MVNITSANFEELVLNNPKPVLLDFWATLGFSVSIA